MFSDSPNSTISSQKMAGKMIFQSPLINKTTPNKDIQNSSMRQVRMKTFARTIDSRTDRLERNRLNMLNQLNSNQSISIKTPQPIEHPTRHGNTPYTYNTAWIDHPPENTSLHPIKSELYFTSYLSTPNAGDNERRSKSALSKYEVIRLNQEHFHQYVNQIDEKISSTHNKNMEDIRAQRKMHLEALEARNRIEGIK